MARKMIKEKSAAVPPIVSLVADIATRDEVGFEVYERVVTEFEMATVEYEEDGNFTIAKVTVPDLERDPLESPNTKTFVGVSKRNVIDRPNLVRGRTLALVRAIRKGFQLAVK